MITIRDRYQELAFSAGAFVGMLLFAFGVAVFILGASIGVRNGPYLSAGLKWGLVAAGLVVVVLGALTYGRRGREMNETTRKWRGIVGAGLLLVGAYVVAFALSTQTTVSAPFLTSPFQKVVLFVASFVGVALGLALVRGSARTIGW